MRARPVGPAQSFALHNFARSGPTKEAHRRALNRSGGLLRSVAGQGHGQNPPVTLPRERPDLLKRAEAGDHRSPTPRGTHQGRGWGTHQGGIKGPLEGPIQGGPAVPGIAPERPRGVQNYRRQLPVAMTVRGPRSASARPGPCTRPRSADALTRREYHPVRKRPASRHPTAGGVKHHLVEQRCWVGLGSSLASSGRRLGRPQPQ